MENFKFDVNETVKVNETGALGVVEESVMKGGVRYYTVKLGDNERILLEESEINYVAEEAPQCNEQEAEEMIASLDLGSVDVQQPLHWKIKAKIREKFLNAKIKEISYATGDSVWVRLDNGWTLQFDKYGSMLTAQQAVGYEQRPTTGLTEREIVLNTCFNATDPELIKMGVRLGKLTEQWANCWAEFETYIDSLPAINDKNIIQLANEFESSVEDERVASLYKDMLIHFIGRMHYIYTRDDFSNAFQNYCNNQ